MGQDAILPSATEERAMNEVDWLSPFDDLKERSVLIVGDSTSIGAAVAFAFGWAHTGHTLQTNGN